MVVLFDLKKSTKQCASLANNSVVNLIDNSMHLDLSKRWECEKIWVIDYISR